VILPTEEDTPIFYFDPVSDVSDDDEDDETTFDDVLGAFDLLDTTLGTGGFKFHKEPADLPLLSLQQQAALHESALEHLNIQRDKWLEIGKSEKQEHVPSQISEIMEQVYDAALCAAVDESESDDDKDGEKTIKPREESDSRFKADFEKLDHASMPLMDIGSAFSYIQVDRDRPELFPERAGSIKLLPHQVIGMATMVELQRKAREAKLNRQAHLTTTILGDEMGLGKTIEILSVVYLTWKLGINTDGKGPDRYQTQIVGSFT
jgi:SNF2 family DNA or RNA helicase